jgi:DNA helicase II / ATP-dependent DNA helicase PcrA
VNVDELLAQLDPEQRTAVAHLDGPLLVVAGPGSGKTRVLTHKVAAYVATGTDPFRVLALTFTNKAAAEMRERTAALVSPEAAEELWLSTFHSFCLRILRRFSAEAGLPGSFTVLDASDAERVVKAVLVDLGAASSDSRAFTSRISYAKNRLISVAELADSPVPAERKVAPVWAAYQERLTKLGAVDFDDLLLRTRELVLNPVVLSRLQRRFERILVDEWQDTNRVQYDIVAALAGAHRQLCVVGDTQQAIYAWRGSTPAVLERFVEDFPEATVVELGRNYPSTPEIVAVSQAVISKSPSRFRLEMRTDNPSGERPALWCCDDPPLEASAVVKDLKGRTGSVAVLVRTNAQTRVFERELDRAKVAFQLVGTVRFFDRAEVKDVLAYLRVLANPADSVSLSRAAGVPRRKIGPAALDALFDAADDFGLTPLAALDDPRVFEALPTRARAPLAALAADLDRVRTAANSGPAEAVREVLALGVRAFHGDEPERLANLAELVADAESFEADGGFGRTRREIGSMNGFDRMTAFVESATLASSSDVAEAARVSVITAHASKGREFDHVYVVGVEHDVFPHRLASDSDDGLQEERRLFFVAVSRARHRLTLSYCLRRQINGEWDDSDRSLFLDDLDGLVDRITVSASSASSRRLGGYGPSPRSGYGSQPRLGASLPRAAVAPRAVTTALPSRPPAPPAGPRLSGDELSVGASVSHTTFGTGTVTEVSDAEVCIRFTDKTRRLLLAHAPLQLT